MVNELRFSWHTAVYQMTNMGRQWATCFFCQMPPMSRKVKWHNISPVLHLRRQNCWIYYN